MWKIIDTQRTCVFPLDQSRKEDFHGHPTMKTLGCSTINKYLSKDISNTDP